VAGSRFNFCCPTEVLDHLEAGDVGYPDDRQIDGFEKNGAVIAADRANAYPFFWTSVNVLGRAGLAPRGGHYRVLVRPYLVLVGSYLWSATAQSSRRRLSSCCHFSL
jgi:hypothetical protein